MNYTGSVPLWARCYLAVKDGLTDAPINHHGLIVVGLIFWLAVAFLGTAVVVGQAYPTIWRRWAPVGIAGATVLFGMVPVAFFNLVDSLAEQYRQPWP